MPGLVCRFLSTVGLTWTWYEPGYPGESNLAVTLEPMVEAMGVLRPPGHPRPAQCTLVLPAVRPPTSCDIWLLLSTGSKCGEVRILHL